MSTTITVHVESEPHTEDLSNVLLNRPLPQGGSFLIDIRLPRPLWDKMKSAGANYWSEDDIEDMDMFQSRPGWRYSLAAIEVLLKNGYSLALRGETVKSVEQLRGLFTPAAKAAYYERIAREQAAAEAARAAKAEAAERERQERGDDYVVWKTEHLAGLVRTSVGPDVQPGAGWGPGWERVYHAEKDTPGAWYDTGDTWYRRWEGEMPIYRCHYGNAVVWYAPQALSDSWVLARDDGSVRYARHVLEYHNYGVFGSDVADRLVELRGLDHYLARARSEEWLIKATTVHSRTTDIIAHYGLPVTRVEILEIAGRDLLAYQNRLTDALGWAEETPYRRPFTGVGRTADGRTFVTTDRFNGGHWRQLTADEITRLGQEA